MIVVIDTDPGVDDALALMLALGSRRMQIPLITTVAGNVTVATATRNARRLVELLSPGRRPVIAAGATKPLRRELTTAADVHGNDGLGGSANATYRNRPLFPLPRLPKPRTDAVGALLACIRKHHGELTVIALGPLTNIATAIRRSPATMATLQHLVVMGGAVRVPGNITPSAEFNVFVDPEAARIVLSSGIATTLVPLDVTRQVRLGAEFVARQPRTKMQHAVSLLTRSITQRFGAVSLHDPLAVAIAIQPDLVQTERLWVGVECESEMTRGATPADTEPWYGNDQASIEVATVVDEQRALEFFASRVMRQGTRSKATPRVSSRVTVVGSANIDISATMKRLPQPGETVLGATVRHGFGGKGANQAIAARRAGAAVSFVASFGDDPAGKRYRDFLRDEAIDCVANISKQATGTAIIFVDANAENSIAVDSGANRDLSVEHLEQAQFDKDGVMVAQLESPLKTVTESMRRAKQAGAMTILNAAPGRKLSKEILSLVDVLIVNETEAALMTGTRVKDDKSACKAARHLRALGARQVVVTLGAKGSLAIDANGQEIRTSAYRVKSRDTTGAGDTFVGYLAAALAAGKSLSDSLEIAGAAGALAVTRTGAVSSIPTANAVAQFLRTKKS